MVVLVLVVVLEFRAIEDEDDDEDDWMPRIGTEFAVKIIKDIPFAETPAGTMRMDIFLPEKASPGEASPVVVWMHGGGWRQGNRTTPPLIAVEHGYAVAAIDYRLTPQAIWPAQIEDCRSAVAFVRAQAGRYNLDPQRIAAWGRSAGGHLAALLALQSGLPENASASWRVQAGCDYCGPSDLELFAQPEWRNRFQVLHEVIFDLVGGPIEEKRTVARDASPVQFVSARCLPLRIVHGDRDDVVPVEEAETLHRVLNKAGATVELEVIRGCGHGISSVEADTRTLEFLDKILRSHKKD